MEQKYFEDRLFNLKSLWDSAIEHDKKLEEVFGGDSVIMTDWWSSYMEKEIKLIAEEMGDTDEVIEWLFWESMNSYEDYYSFYIDDVEFEGSPSNVWKDITNNLTLKDSKDFSSFEENKETDEKEHDKNLIMVNEVLSEIKKTLNDKNASIHKLLLRYMEAGIIKDFNITYLDRPYVSIKIDFGLFTEYFTLEDPK